MRERERESEREREKPCHSKGGIDRWLWWVENVLKARSAGTVVFHVAVQKDTHSHRVRKLTTGTVLLQGESTFQTILY